MGQLKTQSSCSSPDAYICGAMTKVVKASAVSVSESCSAVSARALEPI